MKSVVFSIIALLTSVNVQAQTTVDVGGKYVDMRDLGQAWALVTTVKSRWVELGAEIGANSDFQDYDEEVNGSNYTPALNYAGARLMFVPASWIGVGLAASTHLNGNHVYAADREDAPYTEKAWTTYGPAFQISPELFDDFRLQLGLRSPRFDIYKWEELIWEAGGSIILNE